MAGNKMSTKTKGRDDKGKGNKGQPSEEPEEFDFSQLRKPIKTSVTGFAQARKIFDYATEELKDLLSNECDLLYECKTCRNIFRSLVNFISHKRVFCKEKFNTTTHGHFLKSSSSLVNELQKLKRMEEDYQEAKKEKTDLKNEDDERIPLTKDLSAILERMIKKNGVVDNGNDVDQVSLQKIPSSSVAMFQSINFSDEEMTDNMRAQIRELDEMLSQDRAVYDADGAFRVSSSRESEDSQDGEGVIQISDDEDGDGDGLTCNICNLQFSTQKTLKFHMKYKHHESRLVYPCPDCVDIFSTSWSVYRHLFKVHRKTAAQIRRLRESIQSKAFRMNNPPAFYERRRNNMKTALDKKISEEERLDLENQAWMDNMESDGAAPRCGGCGRSFERRAALVAHTQTCQPRHRALVAPPRRHAPPADPVLPRRTTTDPRRIEIQIRKDYNKGPSKNADTNGSKLPQDENAQTSFKTEPDQNDKEPEKKVLEEATMFVVDNDPSNSNEMETVESESPEKSNDSVASASTQTPAKIVIKPIIETAEAVISGEQSGAPKAKIVNKPITELAEAVSSGEQYHSVTPKALTKPFMEHAEKVSSNLTAFKQKIFSSPDVEVTKLLCKRCNLKHWHLQELCDHMATHFKWLRYACKLCNHKHYNFDNLSEHVRTVHKLKGDSDFYHSTVKAIDGTEALELMEASEKMAEEQNEGNDESPNSRRPSRCSSDSGRLSDDSSSNTARVETVGRKRRMGGLKGSAKRKKEAASKEEAEAQKGSDVTIDKVIHHVIFGDNDTANCNGKSFEENSSDLDDIDDKLAKRAATDDDVPKLVSRRPVRKRTRPKYEDFEYDLSNLLKMEAQGYRESQGVVATKTTQAKKKPTAETPPPQHVITYDINKDFMCALLAMSKKSVELSAAHMRPTNMSVFKSHLEPRASQYPFAKPMQPKHLTRGDKVSPKKENKDEKETPKKTYSSEATKSPKKVTTNSSEAKPSPTKESKQEETAKVKMIEKVVKIMSDRRASTSERPTSEYIPTVMPVKFRRQSLDVIKPLMNKKITALSKSGKILLIKPINRKDGIKNLHSAMQFQTIKLKEPLNARENKCDQVKVVKVPKVDCAPATDATNCKEPSSIVNGSEINETVEMNEPVESKTTEINKPVESKTTEITEPVESETAETKEVEIAKEGSEEPLEVAENDEPEIEKDNVQEVIVDKT